MSDEEVDELLKAVDTSSGEINYTGMCNTLNKTYEVQLKSYIDLVRTILAN